MRIPSTLVLIALYSLLLLEGRAIYVDDGNEDKGQKTPPAEDKGTGTYPVTMQVGSPDDPAGYLIIPGCDSSVEILESVWSQGEGGRPDIPFLKRKCLETPGCAGFDGRSLKKWGQCRDPLANQADENLCTAFVREVGLGYKAEESWAIVNHASFRAEDIFHYGPASVISCAVECDMTPNCSLFSVCGNTCYLKYWKPASDDWFYIFAPFAADVEKKWHELRHPREVTAWDTVAIIIAVCCLLYVCITEGKRVHKHFFDVRSPDLKMGWVCPTCGSSLYERPPDTALELEAE